MSNLIDIQVTIDEWKNDFKGYVNLLDIPRDDYNGIMEYIDELPSADVRPVRRGRWIVHYDDIWPTESTQECSECHEEVPLLIDCKFCPNCGADMRGDAE